MYIRKEEIKSPLLEDDIILYVENPKDYTYTQMLEQITEITTFQDIKSTQKYIAFLYTKNEQSAK